MPFGYDWLPEAAFQFHYRAWHAMLAKPAPPVRKSAPLAVPSGPPAPFWREATKCEMLHRICHTHTRLLPMDQQ